MEGEISGRLFLAFFLSASRQIIKDRPEDAGRHMRRLGTVAGERLSGDFWALAGFVPHMDAADTEAHIRLFFKHYVNMLVFIEDRRFKVTGQLADFSAGCAPLFFTALLNGLFQSLNSPVSFTTDGQSIAYDAGVQSLQSPHSPQ